MSPDSGHTGALTRLRPLTRDDLPRTLEWRNDPLVRNPALGYRFPVTHEMESDWYDSVLNDQSRTRAVFAVEDIQDNLLVGITQLNRIDWHSGVAYFGIVIGDRGRQNKGLARDAMKSLFCYGFRTLNLRKLCLEVPSFNDRALRLYDRFGFVREGILKQQIYLEGDYHDLVLMRLFRGEFEASSDTDIDNSSSKDTSQ